MQEARWQRAGFGIGGLVALAILFLAVVMVSNLVLRGLRIDLTQNRLYTLSPGTQEVLGQLKEPVNLYFYFSRDVAGKSAPLMLPYANRVREFLEEVAARSGGKVRLQVIDPQPFSEDEDRAAGYGVQSLHAGGTDPLYFGLAGTNSVDGRAVIPGFQADREEFLEYDVAKLIHELGTPKKPVIGLLSSLDMQGQFNPMTGQAGEPWPIIADIEQLFTLRSLSGEPDRIDADVDVLMVVHPKHLPPKTLYAIDQFVMRGGRLLLFVDPFRRPEPLEPHGRGNRGSQLRPRAPAGRLGRRLRSEQSRRRFDAGPRSSHVHAGAAVAAHRYPRPAPRRDGTEGRGHRFARVDQSCDRGVPVAACRREDEIRAAAHDVRPSGADSGLALRDAARSIDAARWCRLRGRLRDLVRHKRL